MKLRRFAAVILALAIVSGGLPASASNTLTLYARPPAGTTGNYEVRVTGTRSVSHTMAVGDTLRLDSAFLPAANITSSSANRPILAQSGKLPIELKEVKDVSVVATVGGSRIPATVNQDITVSLFGGGSTIPQGTVTAIEWSATLVLADPAKHPVNDLGFSSSSAFFARFDGHPKMDFTVGGSAYSYTLNWQMSVVNASSSSPLLKNESLSVAEFFGNGTSLSSGDASALRLATRYDLTVRFSPSVTQGSSESFQFFTGHNSAPVTATATSGNTVTFSNLPKSYFFDAAWYQAYAGPEWDSCFKWFTVSNGNQNISITGVDLTLTGLLPGSEEPAKDELALNFNAITLNVGASRAKISAEGHVWSQLTFSMASGHKNNDIIMLWSSGRMEALRRGTAVVNVRSKLTDATAQVRVTVVAAPTRPITAFEFVSDGGTIYQHGAYNLTSATNTTINPTNHNDRINWYSSDPSVATVDNGRVRAVGTGTVIITAITGGGLTRTRTLQVRQPTIIMSRTAATINADATHQISASPRPSGTLTYRSLDETIATVSAEGLITGVTAGSTRVEIRSNRGAARYFTVTVR